MAKVSPAQSNFSGGEFSELLYGRSDNERYRTGLKICKDYIPVIQGPVIRRPAFRHVAEVKTSSKATRVVAFEFSTTQAYILEFGDQYIRFYRNQGQILSGMSAYEISSPYLEADLFQLKFTQSADVLYIVHPSYAPRTLTRTGHTSWTLSTFTFNDGPYLIQNTSSTTLTPSATTGSITITASASLFTADDVGRLVRMRHTSTWGWATITAYTNATTVTATVGSAFGGTTAVAAWRLGTYYIGNYPSTVCFHEDRLGFAGSPESPQTGDLSKTGDYDNFSPTATDGTVAADNAISFTLNARGVNKIVWWESIDQGLAVGTVDAEWLVSPSSSNEALTPTNVNAKKQSSYGSIDLQPALADGAVLFVQRAGRKLREINYFFESDRLRATDMTVLSSHITMGGIVELAYQKEPYSILWAVREDGTLLSMTYERDVESLRVGWARHVVGGVSDNAATQAQVESVAVIPNQTETGEELWAVVKRYINGNTERYIEFIGEYFNSETDQQDAFFVDSGLTLDSPVTITAITQADPGVVTAASHGFSDGQAIIFNEIKGMTELNGKNYYVGNSTTNTFEIQDKDGNDVDTSGFSAYISGGEVRAQVTSISGLDHLEGQTVSILGDGAPQPTQVVSSGAITLDVKAAVVHIGLKYTSDLQMLRLDVGAADGTAIGKTRRTHRLGILLERSLGLKIGTNFNTMDDVIFRTGADSMDEAPVLFTGIVSQELGADYDFDNQIAVRQDQPLPSTILGLFPQLVTQDRS